MRNVSTIGVPTVGDQTCRDGVQSTIASACRNTATTTTLASPDLSLAYFLFVESEQVTLSATDRFDLNVWLE